MGMTVNDIEYLAETAKFELNSQEKQYFARTADKILKLTDKLDELNTEGVDPTIYLLDIKNVIREDIVQPSMDRDTLLKNAPDVEAGCFRVPKVVE
ncbi:MAG: Asp-tRNA(Asn)/Glu-tRNA(Gln) amidotransferase subunit GatC [Clostridiales bacterium]|nr:Asp-tRNA(Asn)/Glu-tRNA(Gln) amidotransferase subunit GatC [Clostridiales bacterium]